MSNSGAIPPVGNINSDNTAPVTAEKPAEVKALDLQLDHYSENHKRLTKLLGFEIKEGKLEEKAARFLHQLSDPFNYDNFRDAYKEHFGIGITDVGYKAFFNCQNLTHAPAEIKNMLEYAENNTVALEKLNYPGGRQQIANDFFQSTQYYDLEQSAINAAEKKLREVVADKKTEMTFTGLTPQQINLLDGDEKTTSDKDVNMALLQFFKNYGSQIDINKPDLTITKAETEAFINSGVSLANKPAETPVKTPVERSIPASLNLPHQLDLELELLPPFY
jgi:hypothetical protein